LFKYWNYYLSNPFVDWIHSYQARCNLLQYTGINKIDFSDTAFLEIYWKSVSNGISSVKPGGLSAEEFSSLRSELPGISKN